METNKRLTFLFVTMSLITFISGSIIILMLYQSFYKSEKNNLEVLAKSQAELIQSIYDHEVILSNGNTEQAKVLTISQTVHAHKDLGQFGKTGELLLAIKKNGEFQVYNFSDVQDGDKHLEDKEVLIISLQSEVSIPMKRALLGKSGTMEALDFNGNLVLASYVPIKNMDVSIVAKIDMSEVRAPFYGISIIAIVLSIVLVFLGGIIFYRQGEKVVRELRKSNTLFDIVTSETPVCVAYIDSGLVYRFVNDQYVGLFGKMEKSEVIGGDPQKLFGSEFYEGIEPNIKKALSGEVCVFSTELDGRHLNVTYIPHKEGDSVDGFVVSAVDVTKLKMIEEDLHIQKNLLQSIINSINAGITIQNREYEIIFQNTKFQNLFGGIGKKCFGIYDAGDGVCEGCPVEQVFNDGIPHTTVRRLPIKSGEESWWRITACPIIEANGEINSCIEVAEDVTEQIKFENNLRQSQKMEAVGTLAGGVAHDFNNVLSAILRYAEFLNGDNVVGSDNHEYAQKIIDFVSRAAKLIKQIMLFSRTDAAEYKPIYLERIISESVDLLKKTIPSTVEIVVHPIDSCPVISADGNMLGQVIVNLCTNASHAFDDQKGTVEISLHVDSIDGKELLFLEVKDYGKGIPQENLEKIFDPFFTTKEVGKGTGLGLSVVHGIVKEHGGNIHVKSTLNEGTTFYLSFPVVSQDIGKKTEHFESLDVDESSGVILLVDDEKSIIEMTSKMFTRKGYSTILFDKPMEALSYLESNPNGVDLVITDQTMPKMTGKELSLNILSINPKMPIIIMTGRCDGINKKIAQEMGIRDFLLKPVSFQTLLSAVRELLKNK